MLTYRADRLATLYLFQPLRRRMSASRRPRIPILMYHSISEPNGNRAHPYYEIRTPLRLFAQQVRFLYDNNYSAINIDQVAKWVESGEEVSEKCVVITFDDGYQNFYTDAFPILNNYGFTATVFLPTAYIEDVPRKFKGQECLTWSQIRELHRAGVILGSHTVTHPQLKLCETKEIEYEIRCSKDTIESRVGSAVCSFSYPFAFPEENTEFRNILRGVLEKHGYENGVSTVLGTTAIHDDRFFLKRLPVNCWDDLLLFKAKLEGSYDWLHSVQYAAKLIKSRFFG